MLDKIGQVLCLHIPNIDEQSIEDFPDHDVFSKNNTHKQWLDLHFKQWFCT